MPVMLVRLKSYRSKYVAISMGKTMIYFDILGTLASHQKATMWFLATMWTGEGVTRGCLPLTGVQNQVYQEFFLLRGNHDCARINRIYGLYDKCEGRYNIKLWKTFTDYFNCLPIAASQMRKYFVMEVYQQIFSLWSIFTELRDQLMYRVKLFFVIFHILTLIKMS